jgi:hypothetical protein
MHADFEGNGGRGSRLDVEQGSVAVNYTAVKEV